MSRSLRWVLLLWLALGCAVSIRTLLKPTSHTVFPIFLTGSLHWWADQPVYADYRPLDHFRYPPFFAIVLTPLAWAGPTVGGLVWSWLSLAIYGWGCWRFLRDVLPRRWTLDREAIFLGLALFAGLRGLWNAQSNALVGGLLLLGCAEMVRQRWWRSAIWLSLSVLAKLTPLAVVLLLIAIRPRSLGPRVAVLLLAGLVLPFATRPATVVVEQHVGWLQQMRDTADERWPGFRDAWTLWRVVTNPPQGDLREYLREPIETPVYRLVQLATAGLAFLWVVWLRRRGTPTCELVLGTLGVGTGWLLLLGPSVEHATFVLIAPTLLWGLLDGRRPGLFIPAAFCILILGWGALTDPLLPVCPWLLGALPLGAILHLAGILLTHPGERSGILPAGQTATEPGVITMRRASGFLLLLGILPALALAEAKPLFDGKTFNGWEGDTKKTFRIEDGVIVAGSLDTVVPRNEFLCTTKNYENFELKVKFKLLGDPAKANAGIQFRTKRIPNHHEVSGYQADMGQGYWGALYDESRRGKVLAAPDKAVRDKAVKLDDWNEYTIRAEGPRIRLWLNGIPTVDYIEKDAKIDRSGVIALQVHGGGKTKVLYKDIRLEELNVKAAGPTAEVKWKPLFDGKTLTNWKSSDFGKEGKVEVKDGAIVLQKGNRMTGITYTKGDFPKMNYEVTLEAKKVDGDDFFATTTFPVADSFCSLVVGGWGGQVVGLSSVDGVDASENETNTTKEFDKGKWYKIRIRVTAERIQAWINDKSMVDLDSKDRRIGIRLECGPSKPFGVCTWNTVSAVRGVQVRPLTPAEIAVAKKPEK